jgi:hypothetical protein
MHPETAQIRGPQPVANATALTAASQQLMLTLCPCLLFCPDKPQIETVEWATRGDVRKLLKLKPCKRKRDLRV